MQPKRLTDALSVAAQIGVDDVGMVATQGFRSLVNNRPDGEAAGQPDSAAIAAAAARHGLACVYLPVGSAQLLEAEVHAFQRAWATLPGSTLAFCRSGSRSTTLWALGALRSTPVEEVLQAAALGGYDLTGLRAQLQVSPAHPRPSIAAGKG